MSEGTQPDDLHHLNDLNYLRRLIEEYLNEGIDISLFEFNGPDLMIETEFIDLDADGRNEILVMIERFTDSTHEAGITLYVCRNGQYQTDLRTQWSDWYYFPHIILIEDLNNDGSLEAVVEYVDSRLVCHVMAAVIGSTKQQRFTDFLEGKEFPDCPSSIEMMDSDEDGNRELVFSGHTASSAGGGPSRPIQFSFEFFAQPPYVELSIEYSTPQLIVHALEDAQRAFDEGDYDRAVGLYSSVALDKDLESSPAIFLIPAIREGIIPEGVPERYERSFGWFRWIMIEHMVGIEEERDRLLGEMRKEFPKEDPGGEFTILAEKFLESTMLGRNLIEACDDVTLMIEEEFPSLSMYFDWGYDNISYFNHTFCPFIESD